MFKVIVYLISQFLVLNYQKPFLKLFLLKCPQGMFCYCHCSTHYIRSSLLSYFPRINRNSHLRSHLKSELQISWIKKNAKWNIKEISFRTNAFLFTKFNAFNWRSDCQNKLNFIGDDTNDFSNKIVISISMCLIKIPYFRYSLSVEFLNYTKAK